MKSTFLIFLIVILSSFSCNKQSPENPEPNEDSTFARGADISWVTEMESQGIKFYNRNGQQQDLYKILKDLGMDAIRLRVWVNPADGWCSTDDVVSKALRAKDAGMKVLIDFHYSDSWADPGKQTMPSAWQNQNITQLAATLQTYTSGVLNTLKSNGIVPEWVQIGNETNDGMLWPLGRASTSMANFALLVNAGYDGVKSVFPSAKVIVHISNGFDNGLFRWVFDGLKNNGARWDIIGMSLYPNTSNWQQLNIQCLANISDLISRYDKPVMICEVGMPVADSAECKRFLMDLIGKTQSVAAHKCLGIFYWEPESYNNWKGYALGAFDDSGRPTIALDAFKY